MKLRKNNHSHNCNSMFIIYVLNVIFYCMFKSFDKRNASITTDKTLLWYDGAHSHKIAKMVNWAVALS